jgi:hypothetical protein
VVLVLFLVLLFLRIHCLRLLARDLPILWHVLVLCNNRSASTIAASSSRGRRAQPAAKLSSSAAAGSLAGS